jgi:hypothetical protein
VNLTKGRSGGPNFAVDHRSVSTSPHHITERELIVDAVTLP